MELQLTRVHCPYCGEPFETTLDPSEDSGGYYEDCQVCCRPIYFQIDNDPISGELYCQVFRDDETPY